MKKLEKEKLEEINGGEDPISGPIITAITGIIKLLQDAGHAFGSGIRRISEDNLCPLE